jgi:hypothetical protein
VIWKCTSASSIICCSGVIREFLFFASLSSWSGTLSFSPCWAHFMFFHVGGSTIFLFFADLSTFIRAGDGWADRQGKDGGMKINQSRDTIERRNRGKPEGRISTKSQNNEQYIIILRAKAIFAQNENKIMNAKYGTFHNVGMARDTSYTYVCSTVRQ